MINLKTYGNTEDENAHVDSYITDASFVSVIGDVEIFNSKDHMQIQLEGLKCDAMAKASSANDHQLFAKVIWEADTFGTFDDDVQEGDMIRIKEERIAEVCERLSYFYLRNLRAHISIQEQDTLKWHFKRLSAFSDHVLPLLEAVVYPTVNPEWISDSEPVVNDRIFLSRLIYRPFKQLVLALLI